MIKLHMMQAFLILLWFSLIGGLYLGLRDKAYVPTAVGLCMNLLFQYGTLNAIRQRYLPEKQGKVAFKRGVFRAYAKVIVPLVIALSVFVGLVVLGAVSLKAFAWLISSLMLISLVVLTRLFQQVQREHGIRN